MRTKIPTFFALNLLNRCETCHVILGSGLMFHGLVCRGHDRGDIHHAEQSQPRHDQCGQLFVALLDETVHVSAAVLKVPHPALVGGRVQVVQIQFQFVK